MIKLYIHTKYKRKSSSITKISLLQDVMYIFTYFARREIKNAPQYTENLKLTGNLAAYKLSIILTRVTISRTSKAPS